MAVDAILENQGFFYFGKYCQILTKYEKQLQFRTSKGFFELNPEETDPFDMASL
jgi:hypothetical protein